MSAKSIFNLCGDSLLDAQTCFHWPAFSSHKPPCLPHHSFIPTHRNAHAHKRLTFTVRPAVALQGAWPLTPSSKVWSRNHQAARSVRAELAISVCYLHNCPQHTHYFGPCVLPCIHKYQPNSEKHSGAAVSVCFMSPFQKRSEGKQPSQTEKKWKNET